MLTFFLDCPERLFGSNCSQNCSMTCGDPGKCDIMTVHCNGGCQVGWIGAKCDKGYHQTMNNTHENLYILKFKLIIHYIIISRIKHLIQVKAESPTKPHHLIKPSNVRYCLTTDTI